MQVLLRTVSANARKPRSGNDVISGREQSARKVPRVLTSLPSLPSDPPHTHALVDPSTADSRRRALG